MLLPYFVFFVSNCILFYILTGLPKKKPQGTEVSIPQYAFQDKCYEDSHICVKKTDTFGDGLRSLTPIDEYNWQKLTSGEWLVVLCSKLHSDCTDQRRILQRMPHTTVDVGLAFGDLSPGNILRRRMSAFEPITMYHVMDGEFRRLEGNPDVFSLRDIISLRRWREIRPVWFWKHPSSKWRNISIYFYKTAVKVSGYVSKNYILATGSISFVVAGLLTTGLWIIYLLWCKILCMRALWKRQQCADLLPALLSALHLDTEEDSSDA